MKFHLPDQAVFQNSSTAHNYGLHNYFGRGPISWLKRQRFQTALNLGKGIESRCTIDMGCADGVLIPTLAGKYDRVFAIDISPAFVKQCEHLVRECQLTNVTVICNQGLEPSELKKEIGTGTKVLWLLETLEHIGSQPNMWDSKLQFLHDCFSLLDHDGFIVISVPKMVGVSFLVKYLLQNYVMGVKHDRMTLKHLTRSVLFKNTDELEPAWQGGHVGFNHLKLDTLLNKTFVVSRRRETVISCLYLITRR